MQFRHEGEVFAVYFGQRHKKSKQMYYMYLYLEGRFGKDGDVCVCVWGGGGGRQ